MDSVLKLQEHFLKKFSDHIPEAEDQTLLILKAHLLIEEMLWVYLKQSVASPEQLKDLRLEFYQVLKLVSALYHNPEMNWFWASLEKLNKLRNKLAHQLEPKGFNDAIEFFIDFVKKTIPPEFVQGYNLKVVLVHLCAMSYALLCELGHKDKIDRQDR